MNETWEQREVHETWEQRETHRWVCRLMDQARIADDEWSALVRTCAGCTEAIERFCRTKRDKAIARRDLNACPTCGAARKRLTKAVRALAREQFAYFHPDLPTPKSGAGLHAWIQVSPSQTAEARLAQLECLHFPDGRCCQNI